MKKPATGIGWFFALVVAPVLALSFVPAVAQAPDKQIIRPVTRGQKKKLSRDAEIGREFDTMVHGHFHTYSPGDRIIGNGSLVGYNEYAESQNFGYESPKQAMWITHPDHGITFHVPVFVDEARAQESGAKWVSWLEAA